MLNDSEITLKHNNKELKLIFNETIVLLSRNDSLTAKIKTETADLSLTINFIDDETKKPLSTYFKIKDNIAVIDINKWYSETFIENERPYNITSKDKKIILHIKIRSSCKQTLDFRTVILSIWQENL